MFFFFFNDTATTEIYTLSLHDALPILDEAFARNSIEVTPVAESTSMALIQRLVMLGEGIALLNPLDVMEERSRNALVFVPLRDAHLRRQTLVLTGRARGQLSAAGELMAQSIGQAL